MRRRRWRPPMASWLVTAVTVGLNAVGSDELQRRSGGRFFGCFISAVRDDRRPPRSAPFPPSAIPTAFYGAVDAATRATLLRRCLTAMTDGRAHVSVRTPRTLVCCPRPVTIGNVCM